MKRSYGMFILAAFGVFAAGSANAYTPTISGYLKDTAGHPMSYAKVTGVCDVAGGGMCYGEGPQTALTDSNGFYTIILYPGVNFGTTGWWAAWNVVPSYTQGMTGTFTPASTRVNMGTIAGYVLAGAANFTGTPGHLQAGTICYESSCGTDIIANICSLCPNGSKVVNVARKVTCPPDGLISSIVENACK